MNWISFSSTTGDSPAIYIIRGVSDWLEVRGVNFPTNPHLKRGQLHALTGAPSLSSPLPGHTLTYLGSPSHSLAPVSHAKSSAGQGGPTGCVCKGLPGPGGVRVQLRELAFSGIIISHLAALA